MTTNGSLTDDAASDDADLTSDFERAALHLRTLGAKLSPDQLLHFYARYKQAKEGPCRTPKPGFFDFQGKQKWQAWSALGETPRRAAMLDYVAGVEELDPEWRLNFDEKAASSSKSPFGGVVVSCLARPDEDALKDEDKTVFDWAKEGDEQRVIDALGGRADWVGFVDEEGMTPLHWSCDRGHLEVSRVLLERGCPIDCLDSLGQSPLHYAASCGHVDVVRLLLSKGADVGIKDADQLRPLDLAETDEMKTLLTDGVR